jgi:hypothetical protein
MHAFYLYTNTGTHTLAYLLWLALLFYILYTFEVVPLF